jgi:hypothetical protein
MRPPAHAPAAGQESHADHAQALRDPQHEAELEVEVEVVDLRASPDGEPLYASLGFARTKDPAMRRINAAC